MISGRGRAIYFALAMLLFSALVVPARADSGARDRYFKTSDGVRLHYLEAGRGETIVFVPGWTMPAEIWEAQIRYFSENFRAVAFDPRAQGRSEIAADGYTVERRAQDIKELLDALGAKPVVLVAWSLGVLESLAYVARHGDARLAALVLVDNSIGEEPPPVTDPTFLPRLRRERAATVTRFVRGMFRQPRPDGYYQRLIALALRTPHQASIKLLSYPYSRQYWKEIVYRVERPLMYVVNPRFKEQALNLKRNKPDAEIEVFEQAGHALFVDEPERFNRLLADFIRDKTGAPADAATDSTREPGH